MTVSGRAEGGAGLIAALAAGASYVDAAKAAGVSERTVRRRMAEPAFRQQVDEIRAEMLAQAVAKLTSASVKAVETLEALLGSPLDFARLSAARAILELAAKYREQHDIAERIAALEARSAAWDAKGGPQWPRTA